MIKTHFIKSNLFKLGKTTVKTPFGNTVNCYDMGRTICDLIAHRSSLDIELFTTVIRRYIQSEKKDLLKLYTYAQKMGIEEKVHDVITIVSR